MSKLFHDSTGFDLLLKRRVFAASLYGVGGSACLGAGGLAWQNSYGANILVSLFHTSDEPSRCQIHGRRQLPQHVNGGLLGGRLDQCDEWAVNFRNTGHIFVRELEFAPPLALHRGSPHLILIYDLVMLSISPLEDKLLIRIES